MRLPTPVPASPMQWIGITRFGSSETGVVAAGVEVEDEDEAEVDARAETGVEAGDKEIETGAMIV